MVDYKRGKDGKFNGSVGQGKTHVPQPSDLSTADQHQVGPTEASPLTDVYERYQEAVAGAGPLPFDRVPTRKSPEELAALKKELEEGIAELHATEGLSSDVLHLANEYQSAVVALAQEPNAKTIARAQYFHNQLIHALVAEQNAARSARGVPVRFGRLQITIHPLPHAELQKKREELRKTEERAEADGLPQETIDALKARNKALLTMLATPSQEAVDEAEETQRAFMAVYTPKGFRSRFFSSIAKIGYGYILGKPDKKN